MILKRSALLSERHATVGFEGRLVDLSGLPPINPTQANDSYKLCGCPGSNSWSMFNCGYTQQRLFHSSGFRFPSHFV